MKICHLVLSSVICATLVVLLASRPAIAAPITGSTAPGGFERADVSSGLALWMKADAGVQLSGSNVVNWTDQSANGYTATAVATANQPLQTTTSINGATHSVLRFADDDVLTFGLPSGIPNVPRSSHTMLFVGARTSGTGDEGDIFGFDKFGGRANDGWYYKFRQAGVAMESGQGSGYGYELNSAEPANTFLIGSGSYDAANTEASLYIDGSLADSDTSASSAINQPANTRLNIGAFDTPGGTGTPTGFTNYFHGDIAEIVLFDRPLNSVERVLAENHLSAKYRIAMTSNDHYAGDTASGGVGYDAGVFGIGRNTAGEQVLTAGMDGMGIEAASLNDNQWVLAGHNDASGLTTFDDWIRWERTWYVDVTTADPIAAELAFNFDDAGLIGQFDPDQIYTLLYAPTLGDWQAIAELSGLDNETLLFSVSDLQSGFYTVAQAVPEPSTWMLLGLGMLFFGGNALGMRRKRRLV